MSKRLPQVSLSVVASANRHDVGDMDLPLGHAASEAWAIGVTWRCCAPMVHISAERCLGSRSDAVDLAEDSFLIVGGNDDPP